MAVVLDGKQVKDQSIEEVDLATAVANKLIPSPEGVTDGWVLTKDEASTGKRKWAAPGAGSAGSENSRIADKVETSETTYLVVGSIGLNPADFPGKTFKFVAVAAQTGAEIQGYVQLYNLTTASEKALLTILGGTPTRYESSALNLASGMNIYEVRVKSGDAAESLILYGAQLEMR